MASTAPTVVRVKRKVSDDPVQALVLSFKRRRSDTDFDDDHTASEVFRFTGTAPVVKEESADGSPTQTREQLKKILTDGKSPFPNRMIRAAVRRSHKLHVADIRLKSKQEKDEAVRQQRNDLLLAVRAIDVREMGQEDSETADSSEYTALGKSYDVSVLPDVFLDIDEPPKKMSRAQSSSSAITCNDQPLVRIRPEKIGGPVGNARDDEYVFDYYVPSKFCEDQDLENGTSELASGIGHRRRTSTPPTSESENDVTDYFNTLVSVYPFNLCEEAIDNSAAEASYQVNFDEDTDDDEDSNAESNWRNEYPDEDDEFENRYEYYDQDYESQNEDEDGFFKGSRAEDATSVIDNMRGLKLGVMEDGGDDEGVGYKSYVQDDYDSDG